MMDWLWDFIYPPTCPHCGRAVKMQGEWCSSCLEEVIHIRQVPSQQLQYLEYVYVLASYEGGVKRIIHDVKFNGKKEQSKGVAPFFISFDFYKLQPQPYWVIPVPISSRKAQKRGYNQVDILFKTFIEKYETSCSWQWFDCLAKANTDEDMWALSQSERFQNVKGVYRLGNPLYASYIAGKHIVLVDDIYTTGATLEAIGALLAPYHPASIGGIALASGTV